MNLNPKQIAALGVTDPIDVLLADIAISIQLSKTEYDKAVARFATMQDWIDREASPLHGMVKLMYPQGSMAIGATIARGVDKDEYDIDVIVDLDILADSNPQAIFSTPCMMQFEANRDLAITARPLARGALCQL